MDKNTVINSPTYSMAVPYTMFPYHTSINYSLIGIWLAASATHLLTKPLLVSSPTYPMAMPLIPYFPHLHLLLLPDRQ